MVLIHLNTIQDRLLINGQTRIEQPSSFPLSAAVQRPIRPPLRIAEHKFLHTENLSVWMEH